MDHMKCKIFKVVKTSEAWRVTEKGADKHQEGGHRLNARDW